MSLSGNQIKLFGEAPGSIVDGPGIRYGVFCQGCSHNCQGCHNPQSHDYDGGTVSEVDDIVKRIQATKSTHGVTLSGGEPFDQAPAMANLASKLKKLGYDIWVYSGYSFEQLFEASLGECDLRNLHMCNNKNNDINFDVESVGKLLANIHVLVDGPFVKSKKSYDALYRGSTNQRLVDVPKSLRAGKFVEWHQDFELPKVPMSW